MTKSLNTKAWVDLRRVNALSLVGGTCKAVKQRENGRVIGVELRVVWGDPIQTLGFLGQSTSYIERTDLTMRLFKGRLVRKTLAFSKDVGMYRANSLYYRKSKA